MDHIAALLGQSTSTGRIRLLVGNEWISGELVDSLALAPAVVSVLPTMPSAPAEILDRLVYLREARSETAQRGLGWVIVRAEAICAISIEQPSPGLFQ